MISLRDIQEIVHRFPANFRLARIEPLGSAGGMSGAQFWRIETEPGTFVLRRWPVEHPSPERLRFIHGVLFHAADRGISFLPIPARTTAGESFVNAVGHLWELTPWMPGAADYERLPSPEKLQAAMTALATFHLAVKGFSADTMPPNASPAPAVTRRLSRLRELAIRGTGDFSEASNFNGWPELKPLAHRFVAAVPRLLPRAIAQLEPLTSISLPLQACLRDIWHDHVLFTGNSVTGLIDFGATDIDTPATDVARLLGSLVGDDEAGRRAGLSAYSATHALSMGEERATRALDFSSTILAGCNWLQWICRDGRQFDDHARIVERFRAIVNRCEFAAGK